MSQQIPERVEYRLDRRWVLRFTVVMYLLVAFPVSLVSLAVGALGGVMSGVTEPLDVRSFALPGMILLGVLPVLGFVNRATRRTEAVTVLDPDGVLVPPRKAGAAATRTPWSGVVGAGIVRAGYGHTVALLRDDGQLVVVSPPNGWRRTDPTLVAALETVRGYVRRYGGRLDTPVPAPRQAVLVVPVIFLAVLVAATGFRIATTPFVPPWAPNAVTLPAACQALREAGLDGLWPPSQREPLRAGRPPSSAGTARQCEVAAADDLEDPPVFRSVTVTIERYDGDVLASGAKRAYEAVDRDLAYATGPVARLGVGDLAFREVPYDGEATVTICRGDVVVTVEVSSTGDKPPSAVAEKLARGVLGEVRFD